MFILIFKQLPTEYVENCTKQKKNIGHQNQFLLTDTFETAVDLSGRLDLFISTTDGSSSLIVHDDDGVCSSEDVSALCKHPITFKTRVNDLSLHIFCSHATFYPHEGQSEDSEMITTTTVQKDDSGIYGIQTAPVILNMELKDDEVVTSTRKSVT